MAIATRTINPLPFGDLEPHRFEDLVRQIAYDFRAWRKLEATGRAGSDQGFDVRGWEIWPPSEVVAEESDDDRESQESALPTGDRIWLIQCKRERRIGPKQIQRYLEGVDKSEQGRLYGLIFAAACDFSKKTRDAFHEKCREFGASECYLWGKAELEDMLFQPKNDNLLFAYFGISLQIRKRSVRTSLRAWLAMKRKVHAAVDDVGHAPLLLRDPTDSRYPFLPDAGDAGGHRKWAAYEFRSLSVYGVRVLVHRHFGYLSDDGEQWDFFEPVDDAYKDPWNETPRDHDTRSRAWEFWQQIPEQNRAWFEVHGEVAYEDILDVDKIGDEHLSQPQVFVEYAHNGTPFHRWVAEVRTIGYSQHSFYPQSPADHRIKYFPAGFPATTGNAGRKK